MSPEIPSLTIETNRWYDLKVEVRDDEIKCYIDGTLLNRTSYRPLQSLYVSAGRKDSAGEIILKVINISPTAQQTRLQLSGVKLEPVGAATVITSENSNDKNSREIPNKIIPKTTAVANVSIDFEYNFPAFSATALRLKQKADAPK
jgi:alpha-N-arabinofuranosidase